MFQLNTSRRGAASVSLPSTSSPLQKLLSFFISDTDDVWRLYSMTGSADSVPSAVTDQLAKQARAVR